MKRLTLAACAISILAPAVAQAGDRMFSYDPVSADAKRLTGRGLTFIFDQGMVRTKARRVLATAVSAQAELKPVGDGVLGKGGRDGLINTSGGEPFQGELYEVDAAKTQGRVFIRAWCPGSTRLWMAIPRFGYSQPLSVTALGDDPTKPGQARVCARMEFSFKGEWKLPGRSAPDPLEDSTDGPGLQNAG